MSIFYVRKSNIVLKKNIYFIQGRKPTIEAIRKGKCKLGQREGFSDTDIRKLNTLYQVTPIHVYLFVTDFYLSG